MNDLIYNWLKGFPGLEMLQRQQVDAEDGACGLFFRGLAVKDTRTNLLGQAQAQKTLHFRLNRYGRREESALFFLMLSEWAQTNAPYLSADQTAAQTNAPCLISDRTAAFKNARCVRDDGGLTLWEADLEITYWEEL